MNKQTKEEAQIKRDKLNKDKKYYRTYQLKNRELLAQKAKHYRQLNKERIEEMNQQKIVIKKEQNPTIESTLQELELIEMEERNKTRAKKRGGEDYSRRINLNPIEQDRELTESQKAERQQALDAFFAKQNKED